MSLALVGCGSAGGPPPPTSQTVRSRVVAGLGRVLTDGAGYTLYVYQPDQQGPSRCTGVCASQWPPLILPDGARRARAGAGVDAALLGTTRRRNGTLQVTYDRWPLYRYIDDDAPGDVTGQAEGMGAWYVMAASGAVDHRPLAAGG